MKIASFMPAVTQMIYDMKLNHLLEGITFECPEIALQEKKVAVKYKLEGQALTSSQINTIFAESKATGKSLYYIDEPVLEQIAPDIIFTQDVCDVCQIDTECVAASAYKLEKVPELISITPQGLADVFENALTIAKAVGQKDLGEKYVADLKERIYQVIDIQRANRLAVKKVLLLEWIDPLFNCGHWIPEQIGYAGGIDLLSHPSGDSMVIDWQKIVKYNPEIIVIAPCGYDVNKTLEDMPLLESKPEWEGLKAVQNKQIYIADFNLFTQSSASTLVSGIELLAHIFNPKQVSLPSHLANSFKNYFV